MSKRLRDFCLLPCALLLDNPHAPRMHPAAFAVYPVCYAMAVRLHDDEWLGDEQLPLVAQRCNMQLREVRKGVESGSATAADMFEKIQSPGRGFVYRVKHVREYHPRIVWNVRAENRIDENRTGVPASEKNRKDFCLNGHMHGGPRQLRESREKEILCSGKRTSGRGQARSIKAAPTVQPRKGAIL